MRPAGREGKGKAVVQDDVVDDPGERVNCVCKLAPRERESRVEFLLSPDDIVRLGGERDGRARVGVRLFVRRAKRVEGRVARQ